MQISNINSLHFGKQAVLNCRVKNSKTQKRNDATLYKYDAGDFDDKSEIDSFKQLPSYIKRDFVNSLTSKNTTLMYVLQDNDTNEIISYAQTSRHINPKEDGVYSLVEEMDGNFDYINTIEPLIAGLAYDSYLAHDSRIVFAIRTEDMPVTKTVKFSETKLGEPYIPNKRFDSIIGRAQDRSQIDFIL